MRTKIEAAALLLLASACTASSGASRSAAAAEVEMTSPTVERIDLQELRSPRLSRVIACVSLSLASARQTAPGFERVDPEDPASASVGRSYDLEAVRWRGASAAAALDKLLMDVFQPNPVDFVFYKVVQRMTAHGATAVDDALVQVVDEMTAEEQGAVRALARSVESCAGDELDVYLLEAGFSDAVGTARHGIALVDEGTDEALWLYSVAVWSA